LRDVTSLPTRRRAFFSTTRRPPRSTLFPYTTLFRSDPLGERRADVLRAAERVLDRLQRSDDIEEGQIDQTVELLLAERRAATRRSEEHTSELQSRENLVCRLLLEKKKHTAKKKKDTR